MFDKYMLQVNRRTPADKVLKEIQIEKLENMRNSRY